MLSVIRVASPYLLYIVFLTHYFVVIAHACQSLRIRGSWLGNIGKILLPAAAAVLNRVSRIFFFIASRSYPKTAALLVHRKGNKALKVNCKVSKMFSFLQCLWKMEYSSVIVLWLNYCELWQQSVMLLPLFQVSHVECLRLTVRLCPRLGWFDEIKETYEDMSIRECSVLSFSS